jgi:hypothetical protein
LVKEEEEKEGVGGEEKKGRSSHLLASSHLEERANQARRERACPWFLVSSRPF